MKKVPMTVEGEARLRVELNHLKTVVRPRVIADIATAREHGDLKENAEYHAAREEQSFAEGRIKEIEGKLSDSQVIDVKSVPASSKVIFGTTVTLFNVDTEDTVTYKIVGDDEADVKVKKISYASPIAKAIIGKEEGDEVVVKIPSGEATYEIEKVQYL
ncbi:transcription elongation factor GreA [Marinomonas primoryensis]|jgi:transcription elongation factor GreA|uniref:Transcription elongation factor GreA n=1 Tax=Marinomonas primoryensis TaxID=178399 RepID=A0A2Z4PQJ1_9GAMM|nr:transcription elongation factor GreA [Marinomonas primoryensis]AWX99408.1 transcription elongation factor GreA [Marinomonas primoryensis]QKK79108.1 transcription elongation factor GreA [Marinomonas primoryensis]|tara:strand:+ start:1743 stop:2219 length:477 start_codon:yes stop_codon:yes gene_type:complete